MSSGGVSLCITSVIWGCYPQSLIIVRQGQHFTKHWYVTSRDEMHCTHGIPFRCLFFVFDLTFLKHKDCRNAISLFFRTGAIFWEIWWCKYCVSLSLSYKHTHTLCARNPGHCTDLHSFPGESNRNHNYSLLNHCLYNNFKKSLKP